MTNFNEKTYALFPGPTNKKIVSELERKGAKVFQFPPLEIERIASDETSISVLKNFGAFDWIIFPDVLTVEFFLQILQENEIDSFEMDFVQVCAFGEAVADSLRFVQLHADVVPTVLNTEDIFLKLSDFIGDGKLTDLKFLLLKENSLEYKIKEKLVENGSSVTELSIYRAEALRNREIAKLKVLLKSGAIDEFVISSSLDLIALEIYFGNQPLNETLSEVDISAIDKLVFQTLREHDLKAKFLSI